MATGMEMLMKSGLALAKSQGFDLNQVMGDLKSFQDVILKYIEDDQNWKAHVMARLDVIEKQGAYSRDPYSIEAASDESKFAHVVTSPVLCINCQLDRDHHDTSFFCYRDGVSLGTKWLPPALANLDPPKE